MAYKQDEPPAYGAPPHPPQPAYGGGYQDPYQQNQNQGYYQQGPPQMGYYNQQQGPHPGGQGGYPPQQGGYGQQGYPPQGGYYQDNRTRGGPGLLGGLLAGLACCCCLDCLF
ncbi:Fc.00g089990.m01.CDS01 [Cosmosporella sp. VM-42]